MSELLEYPIILWMIGGNVLFLLIYTGFGYYRYGFSRKLFSVGLDGDDKSPVFSIEYGTCGFIKIIRKLINVPLRTVINISDSKLIYQTDGFDGAGVRSHSVEDLVGLSHSESRQTILLFFSIVNLIAGFFYTYLQFQIKDALLQTAVMIFATLLLIIGYLGILIIPALIGEVMGKIGINRFVVVTVTILLFLALIATGIYFSISPVKFLVSYIYKPYSYSFLTSIIFTSCYIASKVYIIRIMFRNSSPIQLRLADVDSYEDEVISKLKKGFEVISRRIIDK